MFLIFPSLPFSPKEVDPSFEKEYLSAKAAGFHVELINIDKLDDKDYPGAIAKIESLDDAILRSWMLSAFEYGRLHKACEDKGIKLINKTNAYNFCHELPSNLSVIKERTPTTAVISAYEYSLIKTEKQGEFLHYRLLQAGLADTPVILKDFVKSEKHYWNEACFIPDHSKIDNLMSVVNKFEELRGDLFSGGFVFREFIKFEGYDDSQGFPKINEHRLFVLNRQVIYANQYWGNVKYTERPNPKEFGHIISQIPSNFYTMDVAKAQDGKWMIVELGDGQVAGLPEDTDPEIFYRALKQST